MYRCTAFLTDLNQSPDIYFDKNVIETVWNYLRANEYNWTILS